MVSGKRMRWLALIVHHDELVSFDVLSQVIMESLGYEITQAQTCAQIIQNKGSYVVKVYKAQDMEKAELYRQLFIDQGISAELNPF
jgi:hypothetical protein